MGQPRSNFRDAWKTACKRAGVAGMLRHDLRRTAVRRMEQAGVPRSVAMKMTGHKTEHLYRRYAIVSPADLRAAALKLASDNPGDNRVTSLETRRASN
jgi:integrase